LSFLLGLPLAAFTVWAAKRLRRSSRFPSDRRGSDRHGSRPAKINAIGAKNPRLRLLGGMAAPQPSLYG